MPLSKMSTLFYFLRRKNINRLYVSLGLRERERRYEDFLRVIIVLVRYNASIKNFTSYTHEPPKYEINFKSWACVPDNKTHQTLWNSLYMRIFHTIKIQAKIKRVILKWRWQQRNYIDKKAIVNKFYSIKWKTN